MENDELVEKVRALRGQGRSPKEIARTLGLSPAVAARLVKTVAAQGRADTPEPMVTGCWVSPGWDAGLTVDGHPDWPTGRSTDSDSGSDSGYGGLASVLIARRHRYDKVSVCGYLADVYCLGVKNAMGPRVMDQIALAKFRRGYFEAHGGSLEAPLDLAQHLVFGAVEYARTLGFEPHPDFAAAAGHLGTWTGPSSIGFGRDGKPFYVSGPYDDASHVVNTLEQSVGPGNYDYIMGIPFPT